MALGNPFEGWFLARLLTMGNLAPLPDSMPVYLIPNHAFVKLCVSATLLMVHFTIC
jgi:hypothetical protein